MFKVERLKAKEVGAATRLQRSWRLHAGCQTVISRELLAADRLLAFSANAAFLAVKTDTQLL